jgi:hypothetical protein
MTSVILLAGLALSLAGAVIVAGADAWFSRSVLLYLDAVDANMRKLVESLRAGSTEVVVTRIDVEGDRGQNRARSLKTIGWLTLTAGLALQFAAVCVGWWSA